METEWLRGYGEQGRAAGGYRGRSSRDRVDAGCLALAQRLLSFPGMNEDSVATSLQVEQEVKVFGKSEVIVMGSKAGY